MYPGVEESLAHYGMPRRSGRYPWGSGENPYQSSIDLLGRINEYRKSGMTDTQIAEKLGYVDDKGDPSPSKLKAAYSNAKNDRDIYRIQTAKSLREDGLGPTEIGKKMGVSESTVRGWFREEFERRALQAEKTAEFIESQIKQKGMIDVGADVHRELGISKEMLNQALLMLEEEGYPIYKGGIPRESGQQTNQKVICMPGTQHKEIYNFEKVHALNEDNYTSHDGGETFDKLVYPKSMDSKRLMVRYAEDGGVDRDGVVELRRGVKDLSLGDSRYSQVRILVDDVAYIKGMAVYSDDMPPGVDVIFNTNKSKGTPVIGPKDNTVLKPIKTEDPDNPFGSLIKANGQNYYIDENGNRQLGLINKRADQGDWSDWKDALPSQFLGKQSRYMAKKQLDLAKANKLAEYEEICSLNNPTIKKHLLEDFANNCDSAAENLKAAALPGQKYHVIIPINTLKDTEIYAPGYEPGTKVALVRYPHGGIFEIPILTVNNKNPLGKSIIGATSEDAVGINKTIADRLSGADFDGDTVMVIPTHDKYGKVKVTSRENLPGLVGFDPKMAYPYREGMTVMSKKNTQKQMGIISNLITDMTLKGANDADLAAAVRHSMVVIDAEKHRLDYKRSEVENNIEALKARYQRKVDDDGNDIGYGGASTILSRAKSEATVLKRQGNPYTNVKGSPNYDPTRPEGALIYKTADDLYRPIRSENKKTGVITLTTVDGKKVKYDPKDPEAREKYHPLKKVDPDSGETYFTNKSGTIRYEVEPRTQKSTKMAEVDDAYKLVSASKKPMELLYADYANSMKSLANQARLEILNTGKIKYDPAAKAVYQKEFDSLMSKLNDAKLNTPRERAAQRETNAEVNAKKKAYEESTGRKMEKADEKKIRQMALSKARGKYNAISRRDRNIDISDREWEAIQSGAISESRLKDILNNTDVDKLKQRAMPRSTGTLTTAQINRVKALASSNFTLDEIAKKMGKSPTTIAKYIKE